MSLPSLSKTWQFNVNHRVTGEATVGAARRRTILHIKDVLKAFGSTPWTVSGSSNSVASGMDATDRWAVLANVVAAQTGGAHSWIVLRQTGINAKFEWLIDYDVGGAGNVANASRLLMAVSPTAGFGTVNGGTNGSTTVRPTATDEIIIHNIVTSGSAWHCGSEDAVNRDFLVYIWQSTDGQATRIVLRDPTATTVQFRTFGAFEKPKSPIAAWTNPAIARWVGDNTGALTYGQLNDLASYIGNKPGGGSMSLFASTEGYVASMLGERIITINDLTGGYQLTPMGLVSETVGARGRHGEIFDLWYGVTSLQDGDTYPTDGSRQFIQTGNIVQVWNGSIPIMS